MSPSELATAITNVQTTLNRIDRFLNASFLNTVVALLNKYNKEQLIPIFELIHSIDESLTVTLLSNMYDEFKSDLNNVKQIDLNTIIKAGEWLKNHKLVLRFVANHFTQET